MMCKQPSYQWTNEAKELGTYPQIGSTVIIKKQ